MEYDEEIVELLKRSRETLGEIYPIIVAPDGEVLSGRHRVKAGWRRTHTANVEKVAERFGVPEKTAKKIIKLHMNIQRRPPQEETRAIIVEMARDLEELGVEKKKIASELVRRGMVPYTERYVQMLLPDEYKQVEHKPKEPEIFRVSKTAGEKPEIGEKSTPHPGETRRFEPVRMEVVSVRPIPPGEIRKPQVPFRDRMRVKAYTGPEVALAGILSKAGVRFRTQEPVDSGLKNPDGTPKVYRIDILVGDRLAVEVDGGGHVPDPERDEVLRGKGYVVLHVPSGVIERFPDFVLDVVKTIESLL